MQAILSIKPEFAEKIFAGLKKYEFRKSIFKNPSVKTIVVYASSPVKMVIGEFEVDYIITSEIPELWELTKAHAGISESFFLKKFLKKNFG
jgi:predicted transcriptional regulator